MVRRAGVEGDGEAQKGFVFAPGVASMVNRGAALSRRSQLSSASCSEAAPPMLVPTRCHSNFSLSVLPWE